MALYSWLTATSADWLTAADWGGAAPDDPTADAVIAVAGSYSVGIAAAETITVDSVTLNNSSASLAVAGVLALAGTQALLTLTHGVLALTGTVRGGTLSLAGGVLAGNGGTLDGVHVLGTLAPSRFAPVNVIDGLVVQTASGGAPGSIDLTGGALGVLNSLTLDQVAINLASPYGALKAPAGGTLTLGPAASLAMAGGSVPDAGAAVLANQGSIGLNVNLQGGGDTIVPSVINSGVITVAAGNAAVFGGSLTNSGTITLGGTASLRLTNAAAAFADSGGITIGTAATLEIDQNTTLAGLATGIVNSGGQMLLRSGTLALGGGTLSVAASGPFSNLAILGTVQSGVIQPAGGLLVLPGATLDGISVSGTLDLSAGSNLSSAGVASQTATGYTVTVANGLTAIGPATLNLATDALAFVDSRTLDNFTIGIGLNVLNGVQNHLPASGFSVAGGGTLTLGPATAVTVQGGAFVSAGALVNNGTLTVAALTVAAPVLAFGSTVLTNAGAIGIGASGLLSVTTLANSGSITLAPTATLEVDASTTLPQVVAGIGAIATNGGQLVLGGSVDAQSGTVAVAASGLFANLKLTGTLKNASIAETGGVLTLAGVTLDGVTVLGPVDLSTGKAASIKDGFAVQPGATGTLNLSGGVLTVLDSETLNTIAISLGQPGTPANPVAANIAGGGTLVLGAQATVTATGTSTISLASFTNLGVDAVGATRQYWSGQNVVNAGLVTIAGGTFIMAGTTISTNSGSIVASGTAQLNPGVTLANTGLIQAASGTLTVGQYLTNFAGSALVGGTYEADAGATLDLSRVGGIATDTASITLNGVGSVLATATGTLNAFQPIEQTLTAISAGSRLSILGGRSYTTTQGVNDAGLVQLGGGTLGTAAFAVTTTGTLRGFGVVTGGCRIPGRSMPRGAC